MTQTRTLCPNAAHAWVVLSVLVLPMATNFRPAQAQDTFGPEQIRPGDQKLAEPEIAPETDPRFRLPPVQPPSQGAPLSAGPTFVLRDIVLHGNTVFSTQELVSAVDRYLDATVSTAELQQIRQELTLYYAERGYINSGAVLPDQAVDDGSVRFSIVEGVLSEVEVDGNKRLRARYIRDRVQLDSESPLNVNDLQDRIQLLLENPLIDGIDAVLGPGTRPGESRLSLEVAEGHPFNLSLRFDNYRSPSVGELQGTADVTINGLTGWGESVSLRLSKTEGLRDIGLGFELPVTRHDTSLFFNFQDSDSEVVERPFNEIDVESESRDLEFGIRHPLYRTTGQSLTGSLSISRRESKTFLLGQPFSFSRGVRDGVSKVTPLRAGLSWVDRSRDQVIAARSVVSVGLDLFDPTHNPSSEPDGDFFSWLGQFQWVRRLNERDHQVVVRLDGQWTPDELLPLEKFGVGGPLSVRGYRHNQLVRENGVAGSVEFRIPVFELPIPGLSKRAEDGRVEFAPFVDLGGAWNAKGSTPEPDFISSVGAGLRWRVSDRIFANMYFAKALNDVPDNEDNSLQEGGVSFQFVVDAF